MGFLFRKTIGKTSSLPRETVSVSSNDGKSAHDRIPRDSIRYNRFFSLILPSNGKFMAPKIDERCTRRDYSRLLTLGYYTGIVVGNRCGSGISIRRISWECLDRPPRGFDSLNQLRGKLPITLFSLDVFKSRPNSEAMDLTGARISRADGR